MPRRNANANQIIRKDGNNCFVEVLRNSFEIDRVLMKFVTYDLSRPQGDKFTNEIDIYMTFEQFMRICYDILDSQSLIKAIMNDKKVADAESQRTGKKVWTKQRIIAQGGTSAETLTQRGKARPDNMSLSRVLKVFAGDKLPIMFIAESGPGETDKNGLIVPKYGNKPEQRVMMGLSTDDAKELFIMVREEVRAYLTAKRVYEMLNPQQQNQQAPVTHPAQTYRSPSVANPQHNSQTTAPAQPYTSPTTTPTQQAQTQVTAPQPAPSAPTAPPSAPSFDDFPVGDLFGGAEDFFG